ncbi:carboxypeptidase-like regulatory domain-containing protein [Isobaculum melis]|uniref:WxL domain surface cell wall-binding n=1 Tax=Isobaculum melis TaxID=142588 RepID=A0A1H9PXN9_9LACT|nr:carboxypeptidase-like regulatory domain-containing protein [Isobaculum melis]SER52605.1 hypothetical protein SAMN04488559_101194 [Isobaculum melis]
MKRKIIFKAVTILFFFFAIFVPLMLPVFAEAEQLAEPNLSSDIQDTPQNGGCAIIPTEEEAQVIPKLENNVEAVAQLEPDTRALALGNSSIAGTFTNGACNQNIVSINYSYSLILSLAINDTPVIAIQIPEEVASQINNSPTKQAAFLKSLTGSVTYPLNLLGNQTYPIQATNSNVSMVYDVTKNAVVFTFPSSFLTLSLLNSWNVNLSFDPVALYKKGIAIPPATNGQNYVIRGNILSLYGLIDFTTGNAKTGAISLKSMSLGNCPVLNVIPPVVSSPVLHQTNQINGTINQTQNSGYTYTVDLTTKTTTGITTSYPNIPVDATGSFHVTTKTNLEYEDQITGIVRATSKSNADLYESQISAITTVVWPLATPTIQSLVAGATAISGLSHQTVIGNYQAVVVINQNALTTYTVPVDSQGHYQVANLPPLKGGDTVQVTVNGYSSRDGYLLVSTAPVTATVQFNKPSFILDLAVYRRNGNDQWEAAPNAVTGQAIKYVTKVTLQNAHAIWDHQTVTSHIPAGLVNVTDMSLYKINVDGTRQLVGVPQVIADAASPSGSSLYYQNLNTSDSLQNMNEALEFQYTATITSISPPTALTYKITFGGQNGGGQGITPLSIGTTTEVGDGRLRLMSVPTTFGFQQTTIPTSSTIYNRTTTTSNLVIYDGRVKKNKWNLYVREIQPLTAGSTQLPGAIIYGLNGQNKVLNAENNLIYSQTAPDNQPYIIPWEQADGIRLKVGPGPMLKSNQRYQGQLEWNLTDAPL